MQVTYLTKDSCLEYIKNSQSLIKTVQLKNEGKKHFTEEDIEIENKHIKRFSPSAPLGKYILKQVNITIYLSDG